MLMAAAAAVVVVVEQKGLSSIFESFLFCFQVFRQYTIETFPAGVGRHRARRALVDRGAACEALWCRALPSAVDV